MTSLHRFLLLYKFSRLKRLQCSPKFSQFCISLANLRTFVLVLVSSSRRRS